MDGSHTDENELGGPVVTYEILPRSNLYEGTSDDVDPSYVRVAT